MAFSILTALDGYCIGLPGFVVAPNTDGCDDAGWVREWPPGTDIGGGLHEHFHQVMRAVNQRLPTSNPA